MSLNNPTNFKFRATALADVHKAMALLADRAKVAWSCKDRDPRFPGCTVTIGLIGMDLGDVRRWLALVPDAPMMYRTVALAADYTGTPIFEGAQEPSVQEPDEAEDEAETGGADRTFRHYARHEDAIARLVEAKLDHDRVFVEKTPEQRSTPEQAGAIRRYRNTWFNLIIEALAAKADEHASDGNRNQLIAMHQQLIGLTSHVHAYLESDDLEHEAGDVALARLREIVAGFQRPA